MSSVLRRQQRKRARVNGTWVARERPFRLDDDGMGYSTLHPTKGWMHVSHRRIMAQTIMRNMIETGVYHLGRV